MFSTTTGQGIITATTQKYVWLPLYLENGILAVRYSLLLLCIFGATHNIILQSNLNYPNPFDQLQNSQCLDKQKVWIIENYTRRKVNHTHPYTFSFSTI